MAGTDILLMAAMAIFGIAVNVIIFTFIVRAIKYLYRKGTDSISSAYKNGNEKNKLRTFYGGLALVFAIIFYAFFLRNPLLGEWERENCRYRCDLNFARTAMSTGENHYAAEYEVGRQYVTVKTKYGSETYKLSRFFNPTINANGINYIRK